MKFVSYILTTSFLLCILSPLVAQDWQFEQRINPFPILQLDGTPYAQSMIGGLNTPLPDFVDIDADGDPDLFIKDRANRLVFLRNTGSASVPAYSWETDDYQNLTIGAWFKFADIDNDNDIDLFAERPFGIISLFRNEGDPTNPNFVRVVDSLKDDTGNIILVDGFSVPEWADIDCDNDKDMFLGRQSGYVSYYENIGLDGDGLPIFKLITETFQDLYIQSGARKSDLKTNHERHGANSLTWVDIDDDNDLDLFWGDLFAPSIIFFENQGTCTDVMIDTSQIVENYPPGAPLSTGGFNVPRFTDLDGDNDYDMFVGIQGGAISFIADQEANFYFYENIGTPAAANFNLATKTLISSLDIGRSAAPALADLDGDGDLDLFLSNKEDIDAPDLLNCRIFYFENEGSASSPSFRLRSENYLDYDKRLDLNYTSAFYDLDNSGTIDLLLGKWQGNLTYYRNDGTPTNPNLNRLDEDLGGIDIGNDHAPTLADLDGDGDLDMISGEFSGNLNFFRNTGTATNPVFTLEDQNYLGLDVGSFSSPHLADLDNDGDADLLIGSDDQGLSLCRNYGTPQVPDFQLDPSFDLGFVHPDVHPTTGDLDNDGDLDLICGTDGGGIVFFENLTVISSLEDRDGTRTILPKGITLLDNYPNPFNPSTTIRIGFNLRYSQLGQDYSLSIYNTVGQLIRRWQNVVSNTEINTEINWDGTNGSGNPVGSGVYLYELKLEDGLSKTGKMLLAR
ncbi:MAG: FG-GAP-like repeat-containing protein [Calditrichia bacterium]